MDKFLLLFYGGSETPPDQADQIDNAWMAWFKGMGKMVVDQGNPTMSGKTVGPRGGVKSGVPGEAVTGYTIISANDMDAAVMAAKSSPHLKAGGQIAVYSIVPWM